jgi:hypothetical protein
MRNSLDCIHLLLWRPDIAARRGINPNTLWLEWPMDTVKSGAKPQAAANVFQAADK